jgi:hypothetical protein
MTITLTKFNTQVIWRSPDVGDKTTSIPGSTLVNKGYQLDIKTTMANGETHIVIPTSGTIGGEANFTFTLPPDENCNLQLVSDADNANWIIRCLCCVPSLPAFTVGAVFFDGGTALWNFPAMSDSPVGSLSMWLYVSLDQWPGAVPGNPWGPDMPPGDLYDVNSGVLLQNPSSADGAIRIEPSKINNFFTNATSANPCVLTMGVTPHNISVGDTVFTIVQSVVSTAWNNPGGTFQNKTWTVSAISPTTITLGSADTSAFPSFGSSSITSTTLYVYNATAVTLSNTAGTVGELVNTTHPMPSDVWVNMLTSWDQNHPSGSRIFNLYYGDTQVVATQTVPNGVGAYSIAFSEPSTAVNNSWTLGGLTLVGVAGAVCYMAECWFAPGQFLDFTDAAVRAKFHSANNKPVSLGADGSLPTGVAPTLYLSIASDEVVADNFANNLSGAGALSVTGNGLTIAPTSPSD